MSLNNSSSKSIFLIAVFALSACGGGGGGGSNLVDLGISPAVDANAGTSYTNSYTDIHINYSTIPYNVGGSNGDLRDAIAYLDADDDTDTDVFMATGEYLTLIPKDCILALNNGSQVFSSSTTEFSDDMPTALHARKSIVADFDGNGFKDIFIFDHGYDANPFPGASPTLVMQDSAGSFSWAQMAEVGFHHGGAAADIDNDGDIDIFVGGFDPYFYINDGSANFTVATDRFDGSINKIFSAELIDVDEDGFVDLLVGAHERDGDKTAIYWGSSTGAYSSSNRYLIPAVTSFGAIMDFDAEDVDGDNDRDLVVNRTRDGDDGIGKGFYQGRTLQLLRNDGAKTFTDITSTHIDFPGGDSDNWFPWARVQDLDADTYPDIVSDDLGDGIFYKNNGSGSFTKQ